MLKAEYNYFSRNTSLDVILIILGAHVFESLPRSIENDLQIFMFAFGGGFNDKTNNSLHRKQ